MNEAVAAAVAGESVQGVAHEASKNGIRLFLWEKFVGSPADKPVLLFVHGSSMASQPTFDLAVPGRPDSSVMDWFAKRGFVCWSVDMEGYGRSDKSRDIPCDIANGADDLAAATDYMRRARGVERVMAYGISSGALRAALFAQQHPRRVSRLALDAFVWTGKDAPTLKERKKNLPKYQASNRRPVSAEFYRSVFTRDHSGAAEPMLGDIVAKEEMQYGDSVPTGTYIDMTTKLPLVDPEKLLCPVMITRAEHDGIATDEDIMAFFGKLPSADKELVKIGGLAHTALLGVNRGRFFHALQGFLTMPARIDLHGGKGNGKGDA